jgi:hypothetical protein
MIDENAMEAASSGNSMATYGWAFLGTAWNFLGAEGVSQIADKGTAASTGDRASAAMELAAVIPGVKIVEEGAAIVKGAAAETRAANLAKGIPASKLGPSGKPMVHTVQHATRKEAREAAQREANQAGGQVRHDAHPQDGQKPHFQAEDAKGENVKPVVHHCPPDCNN